MSRRYGYDRWYTPKPPKTVKGGIKTSSKRGAFASKWWGKRWIETLEGFNIGARLSRGRSYARKGQVAELDIEKGQVQAKVQGTRSRPYRVTIQFETFSSNQWQQIIDELVEQPIYTAQLLGGEMPIDIEEIFIKTGITLFPQKRYDMETDCNCPDWSNPCKHIAAVLYLMAETFDRDPFLLFKLRGMERDTFLQALKHSNAETSDPEDKDVNIEPEPLPLVAEEFWNIKSDKIPEFAPPQTQPHIHAALPKRLGLLPLWRSNREFIKVMENVYQKTQKTAYEHLDQLDS